MENLSPLHVKCLANMQMILESISVSIEGVKSLVTPYYDDLKELVDKECFPIGLKNTSTNWERGIIYALGHRNDYKKRFLEKIVPEIDLFYALSFELNKKRKLIKFTIEFGYQLYNEYNCIYFQLCENSEKTSVITDSFVTEIISSMPNDWIISANNDMIWVDFIVDESSSKEKISDCANVFKKYILLPFISKLKE